MQNVSDGVSCSSLLRCFFTRLRKQLESHRRWGLLRLIMMLRKLLLSVYAKCLRDLPTATKFWSLTQWKKLLRKQNQQTKNRMSSALSCNKLLIKLSQRKSRMKMNRCKMKVNWNQTLRKNLKMKINSISSRWVKWFLKTLVASKRFSASFRWKSYLYYKDTSQTSRLK